MDTESGDNHGVTSNLSRPETAVPVIDTARDLIRIDTTNYGGGNSKGERHAAEYVEARLAALGLTPSLHESDPGRVSVVARVAGADTSKPGLVVHGHLDVVPAEDGEWEHDPFGGEIVDGYLWGRGAVDMKDMDAMILAALAEILGGGQKPARNLLVVFFADEENGGVFGSGHLARQRPELFDGMTTAISEVGGYSIDVDGRRAYLLQTGEKAMLWLRLVTRGQAGHGMRYGLDNAVVRLAEAVAALGRADWPIKLVNTTKELLAALTKTGIGSVEHLSASEIDAVFATTGATASFLTPSVRTTVNPTVLSAGHKINVVPGRAEACIDVRPLPGCEEETLAEIRRIVGPEVEVEVVFRDIGLEAPTGGELVNAIRHQIERHDPGAPIYPYLMSGGTDNKALSSLGIKGYGFAPLRLPPDFAFPDMFHGVNERVPVEALRFGTAVLRDLLLAY